VSRLLVALVRPARTSATAEKYASAFEASRVERARAAPPRGVDRTESTLPLGGLPALGGQLLVALDRRGPRRCQPGGLRRRRGSGGPRGSRRSRSGPAPTRPTRRSPRRAAAHRLLEEAGDDVPAVPAVGLVRLLRLAEVVVAGRVRRRVGLKLPSDPNVACRSSPSADSAPAASDLKPRAASAGHTGRPQPFRRSICGVRTLLCRSVCHRV